MGLLTLLRNAFGRSRKGRKDGTESVVTAEPERLPAQETAPVAAPEEPAPAPKVPSPATEPTPAPKPAALVPDPRQESGESHDEHDLVSAAFDNVTVPKPTRPADEAEPTAAAEPEPEPEPTVSAEPEPEPTVTAEPEPVAAEEPAAAEAPQAPEEPKTAEAPEPEPEPAPAPEAVQEPEPAPAPEPVSEPAPEPAAADAPEAPQGPPAPDDESATGGAGGKTNEAEGEAEAAKRNPATPASRIRTTAPALSTAYKAAGTALRRHDLTGTRAKVHLVLDRSASMRPYYKDGSAQALGEQALALAAHLDPEATVHVTFFSTELDGTGELTLGAHENTIDELHAGLGRMGRTSYHAAVEAVLARHAEEPAGTPALVIFQTDGAPDAKTPATQALTNAAASHPEVFFSFVAFGEHENKAFDYLRKLKTENTSFFHAGPTPRELTDKELYEGVLATWRP
ncbi:MULTISPECIES: VWA domain-containing protein [unclassified Streptomyces]|uniref:VWA domain-containing protein n=1 Tax=unclassified Streptomyces TaxID=2593676 RepID=UPI0004BE8089|nr:MULTISPECIES: VWA domain-containing protein [unclassified Streptomyces]